MYFLGIDGGGSKTKATLCNGDGMIIDNIELGSLNYYQTGESGILNLLSNLKNEIIKKNNIKEDEVFIGVGIPNYKEASDVSEKIDEILKKIFSNSKYIVTNDGVVSIYGSLIGENGIHIVSGTGTIGIALNNGKIIRCGGWGPQFGDEGSAYWIGKKTLQLFSKESDNRCEKTLIYNLIKKEFQLKKDFDVINMFLNKQIDKRKEIALISKLCYKAACDGDYLCRHIFNKASEELSKIIKSLGNSFEKDCKVLVSYSGGVFNSKDLILNPLRENLNKNRFLVVTPRLTPDLGACFMAYKKFNKNNKKEDIFIKNLRSI